MLGELYEEALAGLACPQIEHSDGRLTPLRVDDWRRLIPGDESVLDLCHGPTLDVGAGPGRLTVALAERGVPALGIDITAAAVAMTRSSGALALLRDVFEAVPGAGRWPRLLLADGNIGIGGDPAGLLGRVAELLAPGGLALAELEPPGAPLLLEQVRLRCDDTLGPWFGWAYVGVDQIERLAATAGLDPALTWTEAGRWFTALSLP